VDAVVLLLFNGDSGLMSSSSSEPARFSAPRFKDSCNGDVGLESEDVLSRNFFGACAKGVVTALFRGDKCGLESWFLAAFVGDVDVDLLDWADLRCWFAIRVAES
jgi:hypothetical protein